ncbi:MAG TPA: MotA/TolQ/ExbB proton channel family protein, partial [Candidatus Hydrogenedentes bacterium]|nr:MotA/TolQ/ExbB proton channel family protein [Candidatus Hydrogenedentota bacterium]
KIQNMRGQVNPSDLAEGIGNALLTTAAGLAVAIPVVIFYNYFLSRVEGMIVEMEASSSELIDLLTRNRGDREI